MPKNVLAKPITPTEWNRNDGFSPGQLILARVPDLDLKQTGAVPITNLADAYRKDQAIVVIDADTLERQLIWRSEEHTSELQSLMRSSYAVFCLKKKNQNSSNTDKVSTAT